MISASLVESFARLDPIQMVLLALGMAGLTIVMGITRRRIRASQNSSRSSVLETYRELERNRAASGEVEQVMIELDRLSREMHGRLDTKIAKLERLIRDADSRIASLSALSRPLLKQATLDVTVGDEPDADPDQPTPAPPTEHMQIYQLADEGCTPTQIAARTHRLTGEVELILSLRRARLEHTGAAHSL